MNASLPHGSFAGYESGCRTRAMCPHGEFSPWLTCAEAAVRRRSDYRMWKLPLDQPVPREVPVRAAASSQGRAPVPQDGVDDAHGTLGGYRRGCHEDRLCPNWQLGRPTCAGTRREYIRKYRARRLHGEGSDVTHGTPNGYYLGCRDRRTCPGDSDGLTCAEAQRTRRREIAAAAGIPPRVELVNSTPASERIRQLRSHGYSLREIARLTGCGHTTISDLAKTGPGRRTRITPEILSRILQAQDSGPRASRA
ncbi:helix-turn-helix domain-containing protein [Microbacterium saperdae]